MPSSGIESRRQHAEGNAAFAPEISMLLIAFLTPDGCQFFGLKRRCSLCCRWLCSVSCDSVLTRLVS
jgi:hypothetical protein